MGAAVLSAVGHRSSALSSKQRGFRRVRRRLLGARAVELIQEFRLGAPRADLAGPTLLPLTSLFAYKVPLQVRARAAPPQPPLTHFCRGRHVTGSVFGASLLAECYTHGLGCDKDAVQGRRG